MHLLENGTAFPCAQARAVWLPQARPNQYAQFLQTFDFDGKGVARLFIACDSRASVRLNGGELGLVLYDGTEQTSWYDCFDLSGYLRAGENRLEIEVWYQGVDTNCYTKGRAQLIFSCQAEAPDGTRRVLACSGAQTLCREDARYDAGEVLSNQVGLLWNYDRTAACEEWTAAQCLPEEARRFLPRPILRQTTGARLSASVCAHGYLLPDDREPFESAFLSARLRGERLDTRRPHYEIWDCGGETTGLLEIEAESDRGCRVEIGWGEQLDDLRVRSHVGARYFRTTLVFDAGRHTFRHDFQRVGLRYVEVHVFPSDGGRAECRYAGVRPLEYPVSERGEFHCCDALHQKIYDTAVRTLRLCMHEHYEDCPWREQALYAMDSLNQTLCGYYCFGEYRFAAASLELLARGMQPDGFLALHTPGKERVTIPYFTCMWVAGVRDYLLFSGDRETVKKLWPVVRFAVDSRLDELENGLVPAKTATQYWHFYEWNELMSGEPIFRDEPMAPRVDAPYQMFFLMMLDAAAELARGTGEDDYAARLEACRARTAQAARALFWNAESECFATFAGYDENGALCAADGGVSELVQALAVLTGVADEAQRELLLPRLAGGEPSWTRCTLSMIRFRYEALLTKPEIYTERVFADIADIWGRMLYAGATSFWETADGADAFDDAGSLCHGWSAMPVYFYYACRLGVRPRRAGFAGMEQTAAVRAAGSGCYGRVPAPWGTIDVRAAE